MITFQSGIKSKLTLNLPAYDRNKKCFLYKLFFKDQEMEQRTPTTVFINLLLLSTYKS